MRFLGRSHAAHIGWEFRFKQCSIPTRENIADLLVRQDTKFGRIEYLKPILRMSKTPVHWDLPTIPLGTTKIEDIMW